MMESVCWFTVSEAMQGFDAYICHPLFGSEMMRGHFVIIRNALHFNSAGEPFVLPLDATQVEIGDDPDWITLGDRRQPELKFFITRLILEDDRFIQAQPIRGQLEASLGRREWLRRIKVTVVFLVGFGVLAWTLSFALGWGVRVAVRGISVKREMDFGAEAFANIEKRMGLLDDPNALKQLTAVAAPLLPAVPLRGIPLQFYISPGLPNAFALPGGRIVVTAGLLNLLDQPEELLGVLAHESAHIAQHHAFQHMIAGRGPMYLLEILTGGQDKALNLMAFPSELLIYESFSQQYEREADAYGWDYLVAAKINPHGMIDALNKLKHFETEMRGANQSSAFASHPDLDQRLRWLEAKWTTMRDKDHFISLTNGMPKVAGENNARNPLLKILSGGKF
ncbi:MAG: M48 family metallopeptidase [Verrucomicrobiota bacterium]